MGTRRLRGAVAAFSGLAIAAATVFPATTALADDTVAGATEIQLVGITDFHGGVANGVYLTSAVKQARENNPNTLVVGVGDMVGASSFVSSINEDKPAMEQLKNMGMTVTAIGNHEFDKGPEDITGRILPGMSPISYLAANVNGLDGVEPYKIETVAGKRIAFIGGIYGSIGESLSPAQSGGVTFSDPVAAVNQIADQLSDGDESNGEADAVVALVHSDADTLLDLNANVDLALGGHSHKDKLMTTNAGKPIVESANGGTDFSLSTLVFDSDGTVTASASIEPVYDSTGKTPLYDADEQARQIYEEALENAQTLGKKTVGTIAQGSSFNRGSSTIGLNKGTESTLGRLDADAVLWGLNERGVKADIGMINPGSLRADLDANGDGVITYMELYESMPYGNTEMVTTLTGAQLKALLESQWRDVPEGEWDSVKWLGMSSNVTFHYEVVRTTSVDESGVEQTYTHGRVFDLMVNGEAVSDEDTFRVCGNNYLLAGGDEFDVFKKGVDSLDTGYVDIDVMSSYLEAHQNLESAKERSSTGFSNLKIDGNTVSFTVSGMSFTTDEAKPIAVDLHVNGVDFGVVEHMDTSAVPNVPGAGSVQVSRELADGELAEFLAQGETFANAQVKVLFTDEEVAAAKASREQHDSGSDDSGSKDSGKTDTSTDTSTAGKASSAKTIAKTGSNVSVMTVLTGLLVLCGGFSLMMKRKVR